jgi:hypothetical protein
MIFYTYILLHPITDEPLYVGKGKGDRAFQHLDLTRRGYLGNKIRKLYQETSSFPNVKFHLKDLSQDQAFSEEIALIKKFGRKDNGTGILYNQTDGVKE